MNDSLHPYTSIHTYRAVLWPQPGGQQGNGLRLVGGEHGGGRGRRGRDSSVRDALQMPRKRRPLAAGRLAQEDAVAVLLPDRVGVVRQAGLVCRKGGWVDEWMNGKRRVGGWGGRKRLYRDQTGGPGPRQGTTTIASATKPQRPRRKGWRRKKRRGHHQTAAARGAVHPRVAAPSKARSRQGTPRPASACPWPWPPGEGPARRASPSSAASSLPWSWGAE